MQKDIKNIEVNLSSVEKKKLIAHHLQNAINEVEKANILMKEFDVNKDHRHLSNAVNTRQSAMEIDRVLRRDYV